MGNARLSFTDKNNNGIVDVTNITSTNEVLQENHYYAFGMNHEGPWLINQADKDNAYQYNGKEINADHGLNWSDFGARWYDACLGRWTSVDPLAELAPDWTPYRYGFNNPLRYTDPTGMNEVEDMKINVTLTQQETNYTFGGYDYNTDDVTLNSTTKTTSRNVTGKFRKADVKVSNKTNGIGYVRSYP